MGGIIGVKYNHIQELKGETFFNDLLPIIGPHDKLIHILCLSAHTYNETMHKSCKGSIRSVMKRFLGLHLPDLNKVM